MSEALPHRPSAWGAGPGRAPPYVRIMAMYMSCAVAPTRSTRSARYEKTYRTITAAAIVLSNHRLLLTLEWR